MKSVKGPLFGKVVLVVQGVHLTLILLFLFIADLMLNRHFLLHHYIDIASIFVLRPKLAIV